MFCCTLLYVHSSIAIILMGKRELVALLNLSSWCLVMVERLFLGMPRGCLRFVIVVFPDHTHYFFHPAMNTEVYPLQTLGDGNCFYRAVSLALTGSQDYHTTLRLMTALELIENRQAYDTRRKHNGFLKDTWIVTSDYP